ncbi:hypothetical protein [Streptomyces tirandamycinicus]|uniref:Uncharacterized protein n=1 Tax=Streptomyces tirandamycinicus TaxID=2174846 RepID=A0A2S1T1S8_9ACTN|nr:hypothetical protein [Streptomyces tirandamycinicus]AWI32623.1 hypothetical protein DDW44_30350 [Streptomyces tirandamycinicus]
MARHDPRREYLLLMTTMVTCAAAIGAALGAILEGPALGLIAAVSLGGGTAIGTQLVRRRTLANLTKARGEAAARGYAEGIAHMTLVKIAMYEASVFPLSGDDAVSAEERRARRATAYQVAATEELPHSVREAAAAALAVLDAGSRDRAREAMQTLMTAVNKLRH